MSLYRVGEVWYVDVASPNGGRVRRSARTTSKKDAQEFHDRLKADFWRHRQFGDPLSATWSEAAKFWIEETPRSQTDKYKLHGMKFPLTLPLAELTASKIEDELAGKKPGTYNRTLNVILAVLNLAHRKGKLAVVPVVEKKPEPKGRIRWLTGAQWKRLQKYLPPYLEEMARFTLATGLRMRNVLELEWGQVDMGRKVAWVHPDQAKARKAIGVPLNDDAMAVLGIRNGKHKRWVFAHPDSGEPIYKASNRAWRAARIKAGLPDFRWHDLRHTWASWAAMGGVRPDELQDLGGWATPSMARRYSHLSSEHLASAAAKVKPVDLRHTYGTKKRSSL